MKSRLIENVTISDIADKGMSIGRDETGQVYITRDAVPGDIVDLKIKRKKKGLIEGAITAYKNLSTHRTEPFCTHFGNCGGCKWQHMQYESQLKFKEQTVYNAFTRIGKFKNPNVLPILGSDLTKFYRNKLEFSFSKSRWLTRQEIDSEKELIKQGAVGFHPAGFFEKVVDIQKCHLQPDPSNEIRNSLRDFAQKNQLSFYDQRKHMGFLRNMVIRTTTLDEIMIFLIFGENNVPSIDMVLDFLEQRFPQVTSILFAVNQKKNDSIYDLKVHLHSGNPFVREQMGKLVFEIGPKSFFQTNTQQAVKLYDIVKRFAALTGKETLYDLYSGTGSIGLYLSRYCNEVIGIEEVEAAVIDARQNAAHNGIVNSKFIHGDVREVLTSDFFAKNPAHSVVVVDPPRAGLHPSVSRALLQANFKKLIYVSCNPATQARDLLILKEKFRLVESQPMDMFPHTHHIENIAHLETI